MSDGGISEETAYAAAIAAIRQNTPSLALRSARLVLGRLPFPVGRWSAGTPSDAEIIHRARSIRTQDEYSPSTRLSDSSASAPSAFSRRAVNATEVSVVLAPCPVCRGITKQTLELNFPIYVAISCNKCRPTNNRSRKPHYGPAPFYLRPIVGPNGIIPANLNGAIHVLSRVIPGE